MLRYRELSGYKYVVAETYQAPWPELAGVVIHAEWFALEAGLLTVRPGYAWDGASGPTLDTPATMEGALQHDVGYQCLREGLLPPEDRAVIDRILLRVMRDTGHAIAATRPTAPHRAAASLWSTVRAGYYYAAVRVFGGSAAARTAGPDPRDRLLTAP